MKKCAKCKKEKELDFFKNRSDKKHLKKSYCVDCEKEIGRSRNKYQRNKYAENNSYREKLLARNKKRAKENPEAVKKEVKRHQEKHRDKYLARQWLRRAVNRGKIVKPKNCQRCNLEKDRIEGHHDDYSKRLEVEWLCVDCHKLEHGKLDIRS